MNLLHDTMIEMGINSNMLKMFSSTGAVIDPRKQLYSIGIKVERDSNERFLSFLEPILVQEDGETVESGFQRIKMEGHYFTIPQYVLDHEKEMEEKLLAWTTTRTYNAKEEYVRFLETNHNYSREAWRNKMFGSSGDVAVVAEEARAKGDVVVYIAFSNESLPLGWLERMVADFNGALSIYWYGYNKYVSDYGLMKCANGLMITKMQGDALQEIMENIYGEVHLPPNDETELRPRDLGTMSECLTRLVQMIKSRPGISKAKSKNTELKTILKNLDKLPHSTGIDYWNAFLLFEHLLPNVNFAEEVKLLEEKAEIAVKILDNRAYELRAAQVDGMIEDWEEETGRTIDSLNMTDDEMRRFRSTVPLVGGVNQAIGLIEDRRKEVKDKTKEGMSRVHQVIEEAFEENIVQYERRSRAYIEEAEKEAFKKAISVEDEAGFLEMLTRAYQDEATAKRILADLRTLDKKSDDWKQVYFEILDTMLDPRQLPPFKLGEVGAVYLWINGIGVDH